ncbi:YoaH family protein [Utexia brackfieldae]|uniref:YoaH family protein n=1 Tax=Utexia brackfieldae TaxID=3074108 RepID=UPI00370D10D6
MIDDLELTHEQQQRAVEEIQTLMNKGVSCAEAIILIAEKIRKEHTADLSK